MIHFVYTKNKRENKAVLDTVVKKCVTVLLIIKTVEPPTQRERTVQNKVFITRLACTRPTDRPGQKATGVGWRSPATTETILPA